MSECLFGENKMSDETVTTTWPDPTPEDLKDETFNRIWNCIKTWDISVPEQYGGYCGATGNHVVAIMNAIKGEKP